jgi:drug/metabolite transporter (DMT)-like permease
MNEILGAMLALACALTTNVGFLYKHRGAKAAAEVDMRRPLWSARKLFSQKLFALGMLIAAVAWSFHVAALAVAPISIVQAVLAGGIVLLAIMAERMLGLRISGREWIGVALTTAGLVLLAVTLPVVHGAHSSYSVPAMIAFEAALAGFGTLLLLGPRFGAPRQHCGVMLGAAAGILFGVSDIAIKALTGAVGAHGLSGLVSPWLLMTVIASIVAFFASAKSLQNGKPVPVIAVTSAAANVSGILGGIVVFRDPFSTHPLGIVCQTLAFLLVIFAAGMTPAPARVVTPAAH